MHELSIAEAILDRARAVSEQNGNARVIKVGGPLALTQSTVVVFPY